MIDQLEKLFEIVPLKIDLYMNGLFYYWDVKIYGHRKIFIKFSVPFLLCRGVW